MYSWPSVSMGSASVDSTKHGSKIFGKKTPKSFQKPNLNLPHTGSYLHIIYVYSQLFTEHLHYLIVSNLRWFKVWERMYIGYMQIRRHFIWGTWASVDFGIQGGALEPIPWEEWNMTIYTHKNITKIKIINI